MTSFLRALFDYFNNTFVDDGPPAPSPWCQCDKPVYLYFDESIPEWICDCGGIIRRPLTDYDCDETSK